MMPQKDQIILYNPAIVPDEERAARVFVPPLGLLAISSPVMQAGFKVKIFDGNFSDENKLEEINPDSILCAGITAMTGYQIKDGISFAKRIRQLNRRISIIWGGVHISLMSEQSIKSEYVDMLVYGQGEETFLDLAKAIRENRQLTGVLGIYYKIDNEVHKNNKRPLVDIKRYPMLPYELLDMQRYMLEIRNKDFRNSSTFDKKKDTFMYYYSSVGCPYSCGFCASSRHSERKWMGFSAERVLDEIGHLIKEYQVNFIQMADAEFFIDIERAMAIAQGFIDRNYNIRWKAQIRADRLFNLSDGQIQVLKNSGYVHAEVGVESGSQRILDYINKRITVEQVINSALLLKRNGILASFIFLFGLPGENKKDIKETFKLASELKRIMPECIMPIYFFNPYPGVPVYDDAVKQGLSEPPTLESWGDIKFEMKLDCPLVPWLNQKYVDYCHKVIIFYLPLAFPADITFGTITYLKTKLKKSRFRIIWWLLHKLALLRVKMQFFAFPFEWYLFKVYLKITKRKSW